MSQVQFKDLKLNNLIQHTLTKLNYKEPTPIQAQTIPLALAGHDILGIAQTGTGKTAAFSLPILHYLYSKRVKRTPRCPRALILTPTRELALQIHQSLNDYGQLLQQKYAVIFGGVSQGKQVEALRAGVDVLVATPGRLLDLIEQKHLRLDSVEVFVLDEADRMLDMGFMRDIQRILPLLPKKRHNLFFSATMPSEIQKLAEEILVQPKQVEVTPPATTVERIAQSVMYVEKSKKPKLLVHLLQDKQKKKVLVFVEMKHMANKVVKKLQDCQISAVAIHGNKTQAARQKAIKDFSAGQVRVLVATEIAARGIDIDGITHVINFELSNVAESYVHRIGRTARAGADGIAISLVTAEEKSYLANVEKSTRQQIPVDKNQPYHSDEAMNAAVLKVGKAKANLEGQRRGGTRGNSSRGGKKRAGSKSRRRRQPSTK